MWLLTTHGFYSVVAHRDKPDHVLVRARMREDLEVVCDQLEDLEIIEFPTADYRWRLEVERSRWEWYVRAITAEIDYDNFKNAVAQRQGSERARHYGEVWSVLYGLQG